MNCLKTVFVTWLIVFLAASPGYSKDVLEVPGTGDSQQLLRKMADVFNKGQDRLTVKIPESVGSGGGVKKVGTGVSELGRVARGIKKKEERYNLKYIQFASSPVVFSINENISGVKSLSGEQVLGIFSGNITNWSKVGGKAGEIYIVNREPGDSSRKVLEKNIAGFNTIEKPAGAVALSTPEAAQMVNDHAGTIGYLPYSMTIKKHIRPLKYEGLKYNDSQYPLTTPLGLVWKNEMSENAKMFVDFIFSEQGRKIITDFGAVPVAR